MLPDLSYFTARFNKLTRLCGWLFILIFPLCGLAQRADSVKIKRDSLKSIPAKPVKTTTEISGEITDAISRKPIPFASVKVAGSSYGTGANIRGRFTIEVPAGFTRLVFSTLGYQPVTKIIKPGQAAELLVRLIPSQTLLKEVSVTSKNKKYRNKGNPAVELIQQVIDHKERNRMESADYLQYDQYERTGLSFFNFSPRVAKSELSFMLDTTQIINGKRQTMLPVFFSEKLMENYYRKSPAKSIQVLKAQKQINVIKFIDTAGLGVYLNRLYGDNIDIYTNNIQVLNTQFLSPIADHAKDFYKFFIEDTIQSGNQKLVEVNFTPRNKGDLLFEGKLRVTLDGNYAVVWCEMNVNKRINVNFLNSFQVDLDFKQSPGGRYYLVKSDVKADFGLYRNGGTGLFGERALFFSNYKLNAPMPVAFYDGKDMRTLPDNNQADTGYWALHRPDTLSLQKARVYANINRLEAMPSFKRVSWVAAAIAQNYADAGPLQVGPIDATYSFNTLEGSRLQAGGRTTPEFNKSFYLEGYAAYGTTDTKIKYMLATYFSLNQLPYYRFPNNYFKLSYLYDVNVPGQSFGSSQSALASFHSGKTTYFLYNKILAVSYVKDFDNHFSYNLTLKNWDQQAAGALVYQLNDANNSIVHDLTTRQASIGLRYAPHEQIMQGSTKRSTIDNKYPIFSLTVAYGSTKIFNTSYDYTNIAANIRKRFYLSQLGHTNVTLLGGVVAGKVPFPLLNISPANQSIAFGFNSYNAMNYLEFVTDHWAGLNINQSFNGFFLNKIPLIERLKWREYLSFKILYGGLRNENNPANSPNLFQFPASSNGIYSLNSTPYTEGGVGIGNIFKLFRVDFIKRFTYLDHPGASLYVVKLTFNVDY
ncbi:MAG TPA: DUF5686 family protein [Mucilaginibacter sp.]|nr:DUF5686 family protein [Mucilaginibacter sp.]